MEMLFEARDVTRTSAFEHCDILIEYLIEEIHPFLSRAGVPSGRKGRQMVISCRRLLLSWYSFPSWLTVAKLVHGSTD